MRHAIVLLAATAALQAQTPPAGPAFEAVSIKISPPPGQRMMQGETGGPGTRDPTFYRAQNWGLMNLVAEAYDRDWYQISGPEWMRNTWYDIDARVPAGATKADFQRMLQRMLAERFGLRVHHEQKEITGYDLVVAKDGPHMARSTTAATPAEGSLGLPSAPPVLGPPQLDKDGFPILPPGISKRGWLGGHTTARYTHESMEKFAAELAGTVQRPVKDATGLAGEYDFLLRWVTPQSASASDDALPGPTLFAALQQQLGLKLESVRTPIDELVVDHVEKTPTEN